MVGWSVCLCLHLLFPCTIKSSLLAPPHPGGPGKKGCKTLVVCVWWTRETGILIFSYGYRDWKAPDRLPAAGTGYPVCIRSRLPGLEGPQIESRLPGPDTRRIYMMELFLLVAFHCISSCFNYYFVSYCGK